MNTSRTFSRVLVPSAPLLSLLLLCGAGCTPYKKLTEAPVAVAGEDLSLSGASVAVTLDGSGSYDPDGEIFAYEWRYTGWPSDYEPAPVDGGAAPLEPAADIAGPLPGYCTDSEIFKESDGTNSSVQIRYCLVSKKAKTTLTLAPGGYRFTLFVTDDDGKISGDTINVNIDP